MSARAWARCASCLRVTYLCRKFNCAPNPKREQIARQLAKRAGGHARDKADAKETCEKAEAERTIGRTA